jgi:hypothetical protein
MNGLLYNPHPTTGNSRPIVDIVGWLDESEVADCSSESEFHALWQSLEDRTPLEMAVRGGMSADRFAWVFMSGYQAALRCCFPDFAGPGWMCLANAEPKDAPPCELRRTGSGFRLRGAKSWIAGARHVNRLVVTVIEKGCFVAVNRASPGLTIDLPRTPSFLAELSQGAARFDDVPVADDDVLDASERTGWFRSAEPLFVLLALNGLLASHARRLEADDSIVQLASTAISAGSALVEQLHEVEQMRTGLGELRSYSSEAVARFQATVLPAAGDEFRSRWRADARLLEMFRVTPPPGNITA